MSSGHDTDLLPERTLLATFNGGACLVECRTPLEARTLVTRKYGAVNGSIRVYQVDAQTLYDIRAQSDIKTHRYDEE